MKRLVREHRTQIVMALTVLAVIICILSAKCLGQERADEEKILFIVSAVWIALVVLANWKKLWKEDME